MIRHPTVLWTVLVLCACASSLTAQSTSWTSSRSLTHRFDIGPAASDAARIGIHYDIRYEFRRGGADPEGFHYGLSVGAAGFEDMKQDEGAVGTVHLETALIGRYYRSGDPTPLVPEQQMRYLDLLDKDPEDLTKAEDAELNALIARVTHNRRFVSFGGQHRYELSRRDGGRQHAIGFSVSGELPLLHTVLGELSRITGSRENYVQQPVRAFLGFDYILVDNVAMENSTVGENYPRLRGQLAWSTLVLDQFVLRATWHAEFALWAPAAIAEADRAFNNALQLWLVFPVSQDAGIMVKYTAGRLAPDYRKIDEVNVGLSVSLQ